MTEKRGFDESHTNEFSRRAKSYEKYNIIQKKVVQKLISSIDSKPKSILDLGCGTGGVYELIDWEVDNFIGIDKADQMCILHPKNKKISLIQGNFDNEQLLKSLGSFDIVISSSAMQWTKDLKLLLKNISNITDKIAFAIFCDGTFKTIYKITQLHNFLPSSADVIDSIDKYYTFTHEIKTYKLYFEDNLSKFRYIKKSGVSGGKKKLSFKETKNLIENYPLDYLEFEVIFIWGKVKN